jgi:hypothetical protein
MIFRSLLERSQDVRYQIMGERPLVEDAELRTTRYRSGLLISKIESKARPHLDIIPALTDIREYEVWFRGVDPS